MMNKKMLQLSQLMGCAAGLFMTPRLPGLAQARNLGTNVRLSAAATANPLLEQKRVPYSARCPELNHIALFQIDRS